MSSIREIALAKAVGGGGPSVTVEELTVAENGTTTAPSGKAYSPVNVNVPNTYSAGDEGKVVSNGALVAQTAHATVTENGTIDTTLNNSVTVDVRKIYGIHINGNESDPSAAVTYLADAVGATPAYMDYTNGVFVWGSWQDAFFIPRPCMLKYDGTVDYYLDPNDYSKKADGTASDVSDVTYGGNAMIEWGQNGKKIWYKVVPDANDSTSGSVYIAGYQVDASYHAWSFINNQGVMVDHFYTPIYNGSVVDGVMRSISGLAPTQSLTGGATGEINAAKGNNKDNNVCWFIEVLADRILINFLLILIGKSLDTQSVFGRGFDSGDQTAFTNYRSGALNASGLFFGYNDGDRGVKVFGMENWWATQWRRLAGLIVTYGAQKIKLTYGRQDGSSADGYNINGEGYISTGITMAGDSGGYISEMNFNVFGMFAKTISGSATTYYCDGLWYNINSANRYALVGGHSNIGSSGGAFASNFNNGAEYANWPAGAAISCKPFAS